MTKEEYKKLCRFLGRIAGSLCRQFHCGYLQEDLVSAGLLTAIQKAGDYNPELASWQTYLTPHVTGAMRREMEHLIGFACLPKRLLYQKMEGQAPEHERPVFAEVLTGENGREDGVAPVIRRAAGLCKDRRGVSAERIR